MTRYFRTPATAFALAFGLAYLGAAAAGFAVTGFSGFAAMDGPRLFGLFMVNPLHNLVHLALAAVWLVAAGWHRAARIANTTIGGLLGLVTILGFAHVLVFLGIHSLGDPDNFLHLISATLGLYYGTIGADRLGAEAIEAELAEDRGRAQDGSTSLVS
jgi:hypothetical protein